MGTKKRRRSESFQAEQGGDDDARKRLAAFHARMFELPQEEAAVAAPETPRVLFKTKNKKHKKKSADGDDGKPVPMVKFNTSKAMKEKNKKNKKIEVKVQQEEKKVTGPAVVKVPGMLSAKKSTQKKKSVVHVEQKGKKSAALQTVKMTTQVQTVAAQAPQWHSMNKGEEEGGGDDGVDPLEQALGSMKEIAMKQGAKPPRKKHKTPSSPAAAVPKEEKLKEVVESVEEKNAMNTAANKGDPTDGPAEKRLARKKRKKKGKKKSHDQAAAESNDDNTASASLAAIGGSSGPPAAQVKVADDSTETKTVSSVGTSNISAAPSPKSPGSRKKWKKSPKVRSASPKTRAVAHPRQGKPLVLSEEPEKQVRGNVGTAQGGVAQKNAKDVSSKATKKVIPNGKKAAATSTRPLTPIAASLEKDAKKRDMFLPARETPNQPAVTSKHVNKTTCQVVQLADKSSSESEDDSGFDFNRDDSDNASLFSRLIDSAARERWELIEVGRLVRLFAAEWGFKESKTARFLCDTCPELVSVDFLEGLGVNLSAKQLVQVFEAGSGSSGVLMNKMASAVENGHLSMRDPSFVSALERRVAFMETNAEVMELLHPLLESLSTVRDVGCLLKQLCKHWQLERTLALVQQVLLSNVFDDLDGNQDEILLDLPGLTGRLDFPSRLDQEDVDENGNLKDFLVNEDSDYSGEEGSEDEEVDEEDSEDDEEPYEGDTDSEEEAEISGRSRGRNQFIEDEADIGEEDEEEEEDERHDDDASSSDSD